MMSQRSRSVFWRFRAWLCESVTLVALKVATDGYCPLAAVAICDAYEAGIQGLPLSLARRSDGSADEGAA